MAATNTFSIGGTTFVLPSHYQPIKPIGQGAYGVVCAAHDTETGDKVAIKKIGGIFQNKTDAKRTLREIRILRAFDHENVLALVDVWCAESAEDFDEIYLVTELLDTDLHQIINSNQPLTDDHVQYFTYQILRALKYIHSANVLHRDLKPSNLLLNGNCDLKVCDYGLARVADPEENHAGFLTEYVATRWYRAPEVMLSWKNYTKAIDVWAVGCILAELLGRRPLFPGRDYLHQVGLILDVLGSPDDDDLASIGSDKARRYVRSLPHKEKVPFDRLYPNASPDAIDLLEGLLTFNPAKRLTVEEALTHPYMAALHDPDDEPSAESLFDFEFEKSTLTEPLLRSLLFEEILAFHPEAAPSDGVGSGGVGGGSGVGGDDGEVAAMDDS